MKYRLHSAFLPFVLLTTLIISTIHADAVTHRDLVKDAIGEDAARAATAIARLRALHGEAARLDESSVRIMRRQNPTAAATGRLAVTKMVVEDPLVRMVQQFERSIALDTVRNEYVMHQRIHQWFADGEPIADFDALNDRVYAELFLTPKWDPWLGLVTPNTYTALPNDGVTRATN